MTFDQCLGTGSVLIADNFAVFHTHRGKEMMVPEFIMVVIRHFLMTGTMFMNFFRHLIIP